MNCKIWHLSWWRICSLSDLLISDGNQQTKCFKMGLLILLVYYFCSKTSEIRSFARCWKIAPADIYNPDVVSKEINLVLRSSVTTFWIYVDFYQLLLVSKSLVSQSRELIRLILNMEAIKPNEIWKYQGIIFKKIKYKQLDWDTFTKLNLH